MLFSGKKLKPRQVLRAVLNDEEDEIDQNIQDFIVNDENNPVFCKPWKQSSVEIKTKFSLTITKGEIA